MNQNYVGMGAGISFVLCSITGIIALMMWGCPNYNVYEQGLAGQAKLREAESSRQIAIQEAHARHAAAKELAQAEIERAKGVAEANRIIGNSLKQNHEYLMWLWIHGVSENQGKEIIYVPTEGGLPILEAGRFTKPVTDKAK